MNFTEFWSVNNNSDVFFWELAIPIIVAVTAVFMWGDFVRIFHYLQKRWIARNAVKVSPMGRLRDTNVLIFVQAYRAI